MEVDSELDAKRKAEADWKKEKLETLFGSVLFSASHTIDT